MKFLFLYVVVMLLEAMYYMHMTPLPLTQSILQTLAFFDVFDASLTAEEIYARLWRGGMVSFDRTHKELRSLVKSGRVVYSRGYYGLRDLTDLRISRIKLVEAKLTIARRAIKKLRYIPFIRAVFVCNNLALGVVSKESDVDVFIVTEPGRIWIARFLATFTLRIFRLARTRTRDIDRVCLSFYATTNALDMKRIIITDPDIYLAYWVQSLLPVYDPTNVLEMIQNKNTWLRPLLRLPSTQLSSRISVLNSTWSKRIKHSCEIWWSTGMGERIEKQAKEFQVIKMKFRSSVRDEPDSRVVVSDDMLKFHENDRREYYKEEWERVIETYKHTNIKTQKQ